MNSLRTEKLRAFIKSPDTAVLIKNEINVGYCFKRKGLTAGRQKFRGYKRKHPVNAQRDKL